MRGAHPREVGPLTPPIEANRRARLAPDGGRDRARRAYRALVAGRDPAAALVARAAEDRRPDPAPAGEWTRADAVVVAGPDDLRELRALVDRAVGPGAWPAPPPVAGSRLTGTVRVERPADLLSLLAALEGHIERRSPWGGWRHVVESLGPAVAHLETVTIDAVLVGASGR